MMTTDCDREPVSATSLRRLHTLPVAVSNAISAAVDELTDPLVLPLLFDIDPEQTRDLPGVLTGVRARLLTAVQTAPTVGQSLAYARAARELSAALRALQSSPGPEVRYADDAARLAPTVAALTAAGGVPEVGPVA